MFSALQNLIKAPVIKPIFKAIAGLFAYNANPQAKAYAVQVAEDAAAQIPEVIATLATAVAAYETAGATLTLESANTLARNYETIKDLALIPAKAYHHFKNYEFLNGVEDGKLTSYEDDGFEVLVDPAAESKKIAEDFEAANQKAEGLYFAKGLNVKAPSFKPVIIEDYTAEIAAKRNIAAPAA